MPAKGTTVFGNGRTVNGVPVVDGVTRGLRKGRWRAVIQGRTGYCDFEDGRRPRGAVPAAALAVAAVYPDHEYEPCFVALSNDEQDRFMTMVVTDGARTVFTVGVYDGAEVSRIWVEAIEAALENASLSRVYLPEQLQSALKRWVEMFSGCSFAENVSGKYTEAWAVGHDSAIDNQDLLVRMPP